MQIGIPSVAGQEAVREAVAEEDVVLLTARVIDARNGEALPGAVIELARIVERYVTGADGRAEIEVPRGHHEFTVRRGRYEVMEGRLNANEASEFTLAMDRLWAADADGTASLRVSIVDHQTRREVPGARVSILDGESGVTDELGHVWFSGLRMPVARISVEMTGYVKFSDSDIDQVPARWVETAEIHGLPSGCAVVHIWTRR